jgi:hypothetical protein
MAKQKSAEIPAASLKQYDAVIATIFSVERKGDTVPYTSHNGHMFSALDSDGRLRLRLPKGSLESFLKKYKTEQPIAYGVVLKEYALVPEALFKKTKELAPHFKASYEYVASLKPKATTKPKKK